MKLDNRAGASAPQPLGRAAQGGVSTSAQLLLDQKIKAAKRVITFERFWPRVWLPLGLAVIFVLASGFGLWPMLTPEVHRAVLYGFGVVFALSFIPLLLTPRATKDEAIARLQQESGLAHRPITAYTDTLSHAPATGEASALWQAHKARAAGLMSRLRPGSPHPRVDRYDPLALRAALLLLLAVVVAWQWAGLRKQVLAAFDVPAIENISNLRIDAWVTPPAYTRRAPFVLANVAETPGQPRTGIEVPRDSELTLKLNHPGAKDFSLLWRAQDQEPLGVERAEQSGETFASFTTKLSASGTVVLQRNGRDVESWPIAILPDEPPTIAFTNPIEISQRSALLFKYEFADDYGVVSAEAQIDRVETAIQLGESAGGAGDATSLTPKVQVPVLRLGKPPVFPLSLPRAGIKAGDGKTYKDLTAHPWAGLPVIVTLVAKDEAGQTGMSAARGFILPERKFTKPLARALIDQRRSLVDNPAVTKNAALNLDALGRWAESEQVPPSIYLGIRSSYHRLRNDRSLETVEGVVEQLWNLAVRIEDGDLPAAERDLRAAQQRLMEALQNGASEEELKQAMQDLRDALNRFLEAMAKQQQNGGEQAARQPQQPADKAVTSSELQQLLNKIEDLAKLGSQEMAQQLLSELQDILENLQSGQGSEMAQQNGEGMQQLDQLSELMREQQKLLDETYRAQQQQGDQNGDPFGQQQGRPQQAQRGQQQGQQGRGQQGQRGEGRQGQGQGQQATAEQLRQRQQELQQRLQQLLDEMGAGAGGNAIQERLRDAERAMGQAGEALGNERLNEATGQEGRALNALREGTKAMAEQMMNAPGNRPGGRGQASRDPLGRQNNRGQNDPGDSVKVPEEIDIQRAREILDELRRRAGETTRPALELDYIERLIKRF